MYIYLYIHIYICIIVYYTYIYIYIYYTTYIYIYYTIYVYYTIVLCIYIYILSNYVSYDYDNHSNHIWIFFIKIFMFDIYGTEVDVTRGPQHVDLSMYWPQVRFDVPEGWGFSDEVPHDDSGFEFRQVPRPPGRRIDTIWIGGEGLCSPKNTSC